MQLSDFNFDLPAHLIAQHPPANRSDCRLLMLEGESGACHHKAFIELPQLLRAGDLLIHNNTRVIPARLLGHKTTGGKVELLIERFFGELATSYEAQAFIKSSKALKVGAVIILQDGSTIHVVGRLQDLFHIRVEQGPSLLKLLKAIGHIPLPPYITRPDQLLDHQRYQTVYARHLGAIAAPTAGLHFDEALLLALKEQGVQQAFITLHVGAGTFQPVRVAQIESHKMHEEWLEVSEQTCQQVNETRKNGGRIIAVGTTCVRALESAYSQGRLQSFQGDTGIFIRPGFQFQCVDLMITNFHLPRSTLLMLVAAFAGLNTVLAAYKQAVTLEYRFFSYGDALLISPQKKSTYGI